LELESLEELSSNEEKALETVRKFKQDFDDKMDTSKLTEEIDIYSSMQKMHENKLGDQSDLLKLLGRRDTNT
jgi:hypothetical protein